GPVRPNDAYYDGAIAALNFSVSESFSMTVLEASAKGVPVIATRSGGPAEIIEDGISGILVPVDDVASMAAAIRLLVCNRDYRSSIGRAAAERVRGTFSLDGFCRQLREVMAL